MNIKIVYLVKLSFGVDYFHHLKPLTSESGAAAHSLSCFGDVVAAAFKVSASDHLLWSSFHPRLQPTLNTAICWHLSSDAASIEDEAFYTAGSHAQAVTVLKSFTLLLCRQSPGIVLVKLFKWTILCDTTIYTSWLVGVMNDVSVCLTLFNCEWELSDQWQESVGCHRDLGDLQWSSTNNESHLAESVNNTHCTNSVQLFHLPPKHQSKDHHFIMFHHSWFWSEA